MKKTPREIALAIYRRKTPRSQRGKGVEDYANDLLKQLFENYGPDVEIMNDTELHLKCLNGAKNRKEYSRGGCSLIYDQDIAKRLCNNTELIRTKNGERRPNKSEERLDTQARALSQAYALIRETYYQK